MTQTQSPLSADVPTKVCPHCHVQSQTSSDKCPACGKKYKRRGFIARWFRRGIVAFVLLVIVVIVAVAVGSGSSDSGSKSDAGSSNSNAASSSKAAGSKPAEDDGATASQKRAVASAKQYLDIQGFSQKGLIAQLKSSVVGFDEAHATYGATHAGADWNAEAVESAKDYLEIQPMSRAALKAQLTSSIVGFTPAQAAYGVGKAY